MLLPSVFAVTTVSFFASTINAQTFTECNPLKNTCPPNPALSTKSNCDFTKGACSLFKEVDGTKLSYGRNGAVFTIKTGSNAPTVNTGKYIFFGRVDVTVQAAPGNGIVTSSVLQSDDLDEIDWEFVGSDHSQAQTNYFSKGDDSTFDRGKYHPVNNPTGSFHMYSVEWTREKIDWSIDGKIVRSLSASQLGTKYPQSPMQIKLGTWCAGNQDSRQGTREWAGGYTDFSKAPFNAYYKSISITDYAGKDHLTGGDVKEYIYGDHTGSWESIKLVGGDGGSDSSFSKASTAPLETSSDNCTDTHGPGSSKGHTAKASLITAKSTSSPNSNTSTNSFTTNPSSVTIAPSSTALGHAPRSSNGIAMAILASAGVVIARVLLCIV
ncbi:hypothetical protein QQS21_009587 [Conoideocrella luteorostrata]|uniref:Crh-like protein n=1 Tax=Conoideocrella luteorostrata TaxID=1105319 RepID=A0AAJ0CHK7_9HYPO|nr:hypothetical protein QQS21_009587 [Conoideocrella luteorostrata]